MLKLSEAEKATQAVFNRMDALARALGFTYEDGAYVRHDRPTAPATMRRLTVNGAPAPRERKTRQMFPRFTPEFYQSLIGLNVGESIDVTEAARAINLPVTHLAHRVDTWASLRRKAGYLEKFKVSSSNGRAHVKRTL